MAHQVCDLKRGQIVDVQLPRPGDIGGHEQGGRRPAVVVQNQTSRLPTIIVVPMTSNPRADRFPHTVLCRPSTENGLDYESVALVFQARAIDVRRVLSVRGELEEEPLRLVMEQLHGLLRD